MLRRTYSAYPLRLAAQMADLVGDVWVIHDPQPLALHTLVPLKGPAIWRCHIDCSTPNGHVREYLAPLIRGYDRAGRQRSGALAAVTHSKRSCSASMTTSASDGAQAW